LLLYGRTGGSYGKAGRAYYTIVVETYRISGSGLHGDIHVRPVAGEEFPQTLHVRSPKEMRRRYPVGTRFRIYAKLPTHSPQFGLRSARLTFDSVMMTTGIHGAADVFPLARFLQLALALDIPETTEEAPCRKKESASKDPSIST
jgi:hypothetical protein